MKHGLKIAYLIAGENLAAPLLRRQVVELLGDIAHQIRDAKITVFLFYSLPAIVAHTNDLKLTRRRLSDSGIRLVVLPSLCPWPVPNPRFRKTAAGWRPAATWGRWSCRFFKLLSFPLLAWLRIARGYTIFHCRSFPPTSAAIFLKRLVPRTSVLFDPRSDFPEENVTAGCWKRESSHFEYWKAEEKRLLEQSDAVACIGPTYVRSFQRSVPSINYFIAPNNVKCSDFKRNLSARDKLRRSLGIGDHEIVFTYLGSMTGSGWHRPNFYKIFHDRLAGLTGDFRFLFLCAKEDAALVRRTFPPESRVIVDSPPYRSIAEYLSAADFGMMFLHRAKIALGTKIVEYLAASLPVIVNQNCGGAVELLRQYPYLGCAVDLGLGDLDTQVDISRDTLAALHRLAHSVIPAGKFALENFDNAAIAALYAEQYEKMNNQRSSNLPSTTAFA